MMTNPQPAASLLEGWVSAFPWQLETGKTEITICAADGQVVCVIPLGTEADAKTQARHDAQVILAAPLLFDSCRRLLLDAARHPEREFPGDILEGLTAILVAARLE